MPNRTPGQRRRDLYARLIGGPVAPPINPTPTALPPDPDLQRGLLASTNQRAADIGAVDAEERDYRRQTGIRTNDDGTLALDFGDPRSRAYALQSQWQKAKTMRQQNSGWNMYSGGYQDAIAQEQQGETTDYANLLADAQAKAAAAAARRQQAYGDQEQRDTDLVSAFRDRLSEAPNDATSPNRSVGVNPDGSSVRTGQDGVNPKTGAAYIVWHDRKGRAYHIYQNGKRVRMRAKDK